jgi:hypothetical protein
LTGRPSRFAPTCFDTDAESHYPIQMLLLDAAGVAIERPGDCGA